VNLIRISLTDKEKDKLLKIVRSQKSEQRMVDRASIILELAKNPLVKEVAKKLSITEITVKKWGKRYLKSQIEGLKDLPRSGAPRKFKVKQRCEIIAIACDKPVNYGYKTYNHWNYKILTKTVNQKVEGPEMSVSSVYRTLNENELKPNKVQMWLHSPDPQFKEKVNKIVEIYNNPPEDAIILSIDEKSGMQAIERKYEPKPAKPGQLSRHDHEYIRHGTQSLITSFNIKTGEVCAHCGNTRKAIDLEIFMEDIAHKYQQASRVIVIWDNLNTHKDGPTNRWLNFNQKHGNKFEFVYTPLHASWVNQVEIFFSILHRRCLKNASFSSKKELRQKVLDFIKKWNEDECHPFDWTFRGYPVQSRKKEVN